MRVKNTINLLADVVTFIDTYKSGKIYLHIFN